ncbi:MAG: cytochrome c oxidase subunit II [Candidatus Omnitrophica bacterium]|nr:cytochrome c oxidase subunit 2 [bacterium]NUN94771.1 cytochrome c oxidase subunit II [Candidatus Omnitrophota bacterium]
MEFILSFVTQSLVQSDGDFWLPPRRSTYAVEIDWMFSFILYLSAFFFALIVGLMVWFCIRYRAREGGGPQPSPSHNLKLELVWTIIPLLLVIAIFYEGFRGFMRLSVPPQNAYNINVTGQKWKWLFSYPNGYVDEALHVPVDRPVRLTMTSEDVIHSLYIPAFRLKKDVVPGRYHTVWFNATAAGEYDLFCAEFCGKDHSNMITKAVVHPPGEFEKWLEDASNFLAKMPPHEAGEKLYKVRGCAQCHSIDGKANTGPTFKGLMGHEVALKGGTTIVVDENYIRESILEPNAKVVAGFQPVMPTFKGRIKDEEITAIIEYLKTLTE